MHLVWWGRDYRTPQFDVHVPILQSKPGTLVGEAYPHEGELDMSQRSFTLEWEQQWRVAAQITPDGGPVYFMSGINNQPDCQIVLTRQKVKYLHSGWEQHLS